MVAHVVYTIVFIPYRQQKRETMYYSSICSIFKNEAQYMREWIEYHLMIGFEHFYLYNNFSSDNYREVLLPYIDSGVVTLTEWPVKYGQNSAYEDCIKKYKEESKWIAFLDIDEFVCPRTETNIRTWLQRFERYPAVKIYWMMFGTNGIVKDCPDKLVIEQYTCSWEKLRVTGKFIWNTDFEPQGISPHHIICKYNLGWMKFHLPLINETCHFVGFANAEKIPHTNTIQLNHYWSKSISEYIHKINKGDVLSEKNERERLNLDFFYWHENRNVREEKTIYRFLAQLKVRMGDVNLRFDSNPR